MVRRRTGLMMVYIDAVVWIEFFLSVCGGRLSDYLVVVEGFVVLSLLGQVNAVLLFAFHLFLLFCSIFIVLIKLTSVRLTKTKLHIEY